MHKAIIFDFDGVIADSEILANSVLAEQITALGFPVTVEQVLHRYQGTRSTDFAAAIKEGTGNEMPPVFKQEWEQATLARLEADLEEVNGAREFIRKWVSIPHCIASSSSPRRLSVSLEKLGLTEDFGANVFSADSVSRSKPFPDIFLLAAEKLGVAPTNCVVIEDSANGVRAGIAAGMTTIGLCAAGHIREGHEAKLKDAGAHYTANDWSEVDRLMPRLFEA